MGKYQKNIEAARRISVMQYLETYHPGELVRKTDKEYCTKAQQPCYHARKWAVSLVFAEQRWQQCTRLSGKGRGHGFCLSGTVAERNDTDAGLCSDG